MRKTAPLGHIRTPFYIRGHAGSIERLCGNFPNPEELAQMRSGLPAQPLYRVRFLQKDVWPDYRGPEADVVEVSHRDVLGTPVTGGRVAVGEFLLDRLMPDRSAEQGR